MTRRAAFLIWLSLMTGCARAPAGGWPSLAPRAGERGAVAALPPQSPTANTADGDTQPAGANADSNARLTSAIRDLDAAEARWQAQRTATARAVAAAQGKAEGDAAWSEGQLELSRLEQAGAAFTDIHATLDSIAGDIASDAAGGAGISAASLSAVGRAVARAKADGVAHARAFAALKTALAG